MWRHLSPSGRVPHAPYLLFKVIGETNEPDHIVATLKGIICIKSPLYILSIFIYLESEHGGGRG